MFFSELVLLLARKRALLGLPPLVEEEEELKNKEWKEVEGIDAVESHVPALEEEGKNKTALEEKSDAASEEEKAGELVADEDSSGVENLKPATDTINIDMNSGGGISNLKQTQQQNNRARLMDRLAARKRRSGNDKEQTTLERDKKIREKAAQAEQRRLDIIANRKRQAQATTQKMFRLMDAQRMALQSEANK